MPDQGSASSEHALMQEITVPLSTLPDDPAPSLPDADFPVVLRGYDRVAVDDYVTRTTELVAELQGSRSPEAAVRRALERVGEEVSGILQRAHDTATQITAQSRSEAEDRLERARQEAAEATDRAASEVRALGADTDRIRAERRRIMEDVRELADQLLALAESAADQPPDAPNSAEGVEQPGAIEGTGAGEHAGAREGPGPGGPRGAGEHPRLTEPPGWLG